MKCIVLAGGRGERLWPLSRNNFPKQFIKVQKNHSIFQETIARNIPYCDEFIIVTNYAYRSIITNQMRAFQGVDYSCVYEEIPRKTTAAVALSCLRLQPSELVFVVSSNHLIDTGECKGGSYKESILAAKECAEAGKIVMFGIKAKEISDRFGYFTKDGKLYIEKPDRYQKQKYLGRETYQNLGMLLFRNEVLLKELSILCPDLYRKCQRAEGKPEQDGILFSADVLKGIEALPIECSVLERSDKRQGLEIGFQWSDIGSLEDLGKTELVNEGVCVVHEGTDTTIINRSQDQAVVVNDLDNVLVVNTSDAVYIGRKGRSHALKEILHDHTELIPYSEQGRMFYRLWGRYEQLVEEADYRVRKIELLPGKMIREHQHDLICENWTMVRGQIKVSLDGESRIYGENDFISIRPGVFHQIENIGTETALVIETALGKTLYGTDLPSDNTETGGQEASGSIPDPIVRLSPVFKDYLWGGTKLRDLYGKSCDFDTIAESWELSAHPDGNCLIASGKHKGMAFGAYLDLVGKEALGWKCAQMQYFPLLIKFIDAKQSLSVQVHPDDEYALEHEGEYGKNELWYVIDTEPGAGLYVGFSRDVDRDEVQRRVEDNTILDILNFYPTKPGDLFFIPAGTVHAIGAGNLICEVQQSSNSTYRLYDYDRRDRFGKPRELHLQKALDVLNYSRYEPADLEMERENGRIWARCKYFETTVIEGETSLLLEDDSFYAASCLKGAGTIEIDASKMQVSAGDTCFIRAVNGTMVIRGSVSLALTKV